MWWGRGWRWRFWLTGLPGWARWYYPYSPVASTTQTYSQPQATFPVLPWFWRCRWFPWLPRWWWTGMYGPITWTPQGPMLAQSQQPSTQPSNELQNLEQEMKALEQEKQLIEKELEEIKKRIEELKGKG